MHGHVTKLRRAHIFDIASPLAAAAVGANEQHVMCVRACAIVVRLPSPRALTSYIYINNKIALYNKHLVACHLL